MHIVNLMQCTNLGGMEQASLRLMRALMQRGHSLQVVSLNPVGLLNELLVRSGIAVSGLKYEGVGGWRSVHKVRRQLRGIKADALIMTGQNLLGFFALGDMFEGRRLLAMHSYHSGVKPEWQWRLIYLVACNKFNAITFPSDFVRKEAERLCPALQGRSVTVRNPLAIPSLGDDDSARVRLRDRLDIPRRTPLVGNAGWLIERKRFDVFLHTAYLIVQRDDRIHFVIAGDGDKRQELESLAAALGIGGRVHWLGWQTDLSCFYRGIDVLLFNSDGDALPTTPLEAMSYARPVVASVVSGGLDEVITSRAIGILVDRHDPCFLSVAVLEMLSPAGAQIGMRGRERIAEMSDPHPIAESVESLLKSGVEIAPKSNS